MTNQEVKEEIMKMAEKSVKLKIDNIEEKIEIFSMAEDKNLFMEQKAIITNMVNLATENGYKVTLDDVDITTAKRMRYYQSIVLRRVNDKV